MTPDELCTFRAKALSYACGKKFNEYANDFAGYCVVRAMQGEFKGTLQLATLLIDFKRTWFGDLRSPDGQARATAVMIRTENVAAHSNQMRAREIARVIPLQGEDRAIFYMHFVYGFTAVECAEAWNLSVNQMTYKIALVFKQAVKEMMAAGNDGVTDGKG